MRADPSSRVNGRSGDLKKGIVDGAVSVDGGFDVTEVALVVVVDGLVSVDTVFVAVGLCFPSPAWTELRANTVEAVEAKTVETSTSRNSSISTGKTKKGLNTKINRWIAKFLSAITKHVIKNNDIMQKLEAKVNSYSTTNRAEF